MKINKVSRTQRNVNNVGAAAAAAVGHPDARRSRGNIKTSAESKIPREPEIQTVNRVSTLCSVFVGNTNLTYLIEGMTGHVRVFAARKIII